MLSARDYPGESGTKFGRDMRRAKRAKLIGRDRHPNPAVVHVEDFQTFAFGPLRKIEWTEPVWQPWQPLKPLVVESEMFQRFAGHRFRVCEQSR